MNIARMTQLARNASFDTLLDELLRDGRRLPLPVRLRLSDEVHTPVVALGMALEQACAWQGRMTDDIVDLLLCTLDQVEAAAERGGRTPVAAACALSGFASLRRVMGAADWTTLPMGLRVRRAVADLSHVLFAAQASMQLALGARRDGWAAADERGLVGDVIDSAIVLWRLAPAADAVEGEFRLDDLEFALMRPAVRRGADGVERLLRRTRGRAEAA